VNNAPPLDFSRTTAHIDRMRKRKRKLGRKPIIDHTGARLERYDVQLFERQWVWLGALSEGNRSQQLRRMIDAAMTEEGGTHVSAAS
jgi:hypothetical protein